MTSKHRQEDELDRLLAEFNGRRKDCVTRRAITRRKVARSHRLGKRGLLVVLVSIVALSSFGMTAFSLPALHSVLQSSQTSLKAVLIDTLSLTDPDPSFIWNVTHTLSVAGYTVDYYGPSQVTVGLFRNLAFQGYGMIILRSHTAVFHGIPTSASIVTSEPYSNSKYVYEQLIGQVASAVVRPGNTFFAITPSFVRNAIQGSFRDTLVVLMGCSTLWGNHDLATAFMDRGTSAFVGWDNAVSSWYTDVTTQNFVSSLAHGHTVRDAVAAAGGPDPTYQGRLGFLDTKAISQEQFNSQTTTIAEWATLLFFSLLVTRKLVKGRELQRCLCPTCQKALR